MSKQFWWTIGTVFIFFLLLSFAGVKQHSVVSYIQLTDNDLLPKKGPCDLNEKDKLRKNNFLICTLLTDSKYEKKKKIKIPLGSIGTYISGKNKLDTNIVLKKEELDPNGKYIAFTFDDGPSSLVTPRILDILKEYEVKATFFMLGNQVNKNPLLAKRVADEGHEIGNHSYSHSKLVNLTEGDIRNEIEGTNQIIEEVTGFKPTSFRPPYGDYNETVQAIAFGNKAPIILWSVDSEDWKNKNAEAVKNMVLNNLRPGSIVLLHDIHSTTAEALPALLTVLKEDGYQFITVSELLSLEPTIPAGPYYGSKK